MYKDLLNREKARIFRIIHRDHFGWLLEHGLHCKSSDIVDPNYVTIGNQELIDKRSNRRVPCPPGGTLSDYVPFYFTPFSPMLLNIKTGWRGIQRRDSAEIVVLVSSLRTLHSEGIPFLFSDRHAYLAIAQFYSDLQCLDRIDWSILQKRDFKQSEDYSDRFERYQAEALVHRHMPLRGIRGVVCYNDSTAACLMQHVANRGLQLPVAVRPTWYF